MKKKFSASLSPGGIQDLIDQLQEYKKQMNSKVEIAIKRLAEEGIQIATLNVIDSDAIDTGTLVNSFKIKKGDLIQYGSQWIVYTDCPWAKYVEFGTGIIGKNSEHHPLTGEFGWKHDSNEHGEAGWYYFKDGKWHWTKGMESRPFMYQTAMELRQRAAKIISEVFNE